MLLTHFEIQARKFADRLKKLSAQATTLANEVTQREATERDVAISAELAQQYIDTLDEILDSDLTIPPEPVTVAIKGQKIKFSGIEDVAEWITNQPKPTN